MLYLRLVLTMCVTCFVVFGDEWDAMQSDSDLSAVLGERRLGEVTHIFTVPNGTITYGEVKQKGVWSWHGTGDTYRGFVVPYEDAYSAKHCGKFLGNYTVQGTGAGKPLVWKAKLQGSCGDHWGVYSIVWPVKPAIFPSPNSGIPGMKTYSDKRVKGLFAIRVTCHQIIDNVLTDLKPALAGMSAIQCHVEKSDQGLGGTAKFKIPEQLVPTGEVQYHYSVEKDDKTTITFNGDNTYDYMIGCLQARFTNTVETSYYQLFFFGAIDRGFGYIGEPYLDPPENHPDYPNTLYGISTWIELRNRRTRAQQKDYTKQEGHVVYFKTRGHDCINCQNYFSSNKAPKEPSGLAILEK